jgi:hypothetical protein
MYVHKQTASLSHKFTVPLKERKCGKNEEQNMELLLIECKKLVSSPKL